MGEFTLKKLLKERKENFKLLKSGLEGICEKYGEKVLVTPNNRISLAISLQNMNETVFIPNNIDATFFGSYLFSRRVSGVRVVAP